MGQHVGGAWQAFCSLHQTLLLSFEVDWSLSVLVLQEHCSSTGKRGSHRRLEFMVGGWCTRPAAEFSLMPLVMLLVNVFNCAPLQMLR